MHLLFATKQKAPIYTIPNLLEGEAKEGNPKAN